MTKHNPPSALKIAQARNSIDPVFLDSPLLHSSRLGLELFAKDETDNPIRSFKGRGTDFFIATRQDVKPMVSASAGNFGQGLAYNAAKKALPMLIFASVNANPRKIEAMRNFGAEVILAGDDFDAAKDHAALYASEHGMEFVEDGARAEIAEGAGTIAAELTDAVPALDRIFVPLGNGALAAGIGCWFKANSPDTKVIAVAAKGAPSMVQSHLAGKIITTAQADTIADGIAIRNPIPIALQWLRETIDDVVLVDDSQILAAMQFAKANWNRLIEPAGAAGLAAILADASNLQQKRVSTILCGGNLTQQQISTWFD